jgi:hypothetical protein
LERIPGRAQPASIQLVATPRTLPDHADGAIAQPAGGVWSTN